MQTTTTSAAASVAMPTRSVLWTRLLCIPSWGMAAWVAIFIAAIKIHPVTAKHLMSRTAIEFVALSAVISPFCLLAAVIMTLRGWKKTRRREVSTWALLTLSAIAVLATWAVLGHFNQLR